MITTIIDEIRINTKNVQMMNISLNRLLRKKFLCVTHGRTSNMPDHELQISIEKITIRTAMI